MLIPVKNNFYPCIVHYCVAMSIYNRKISEEKALRITTSYVVNAQHVCKSICLGHSLPQEIFSGENGFM